MSALDQSAYDLEFIHHKSNISSCLLLMSQLASKVKAMRHTEAATYPANISIEQVKNKYMRINFNSGQCYVKMSADRVLPRPDMTPNNEEHSLRPHRVRRRTHIFAASAILNHKKLVAEKNWVGDHASNCQHMPETAEQVQELTVSSSLQIGSTKH